MVADQIIIKKKQYEKQKQEGRKRKMNRLEDMVIITTSHIVHTRIMMCQSSEQV